MKISVSIGRTINMGNYESARIDVSTEMECVVADMDATYAKAKAWCDERVTEELEALSAERPRTRR